MAIAVAHDAHPQAAVAMSEATATSRSEPRRRGAIGAPLMLFVGSVGLYVGVALWTGQTKMLDDRRRGRSPADEWSRSGSSRVGQTFAILAGSIDLSVANLISVAAVLASYIMQGRPEMMLPAVAVGAGRLRRRRRRQWRARRAAAGQSADRHAGRRAHPAGAALGELHRFCRLGAARVPGGRLWRVRRRALFGARRCSFSRSLASVLLRATRFGAHLYAVGGNAEGARLAGIRTDLVTIGAHVVCSLSAGDHRASISRAACVPARRGSGATASTISSRSPSS